MTKNYSSSRTLKVDWSRFHKDVGTLSEILAKKGPFERLVAITRGGLGPATLLAQMLDIKMVDTICISSYDDKIQRAGVPVLHKGLEGDGAGWLVVDDLADSGRTLASVRQMLPKAHIATVYGKPEGSPMVDSLAVPVEQSVWLIFPWDEMP